VLKTEQIIFLLCFEVGHRIAPLICEGRSQDNLVPVWRWTFSWCKELVWRRILNDQRLPQLIQDLYRIVKELEAMFPGRHFTPDGHLVGSLGECLAAYHYGIELHNASHRGHDGTCAGREVQIKATQGNSVALRSEPNHLLVLRLDKTGGFEEVYNGPGRPVWDLVKDKPRPSNGQLQVSVSRLRSLMNGTPHSLRLPCVRTMTAAATRTNAE
jgi:hypothetical protein